MSAVYLTRVDDARNMARYYRMSLQPTLFGEWVSIGVVTGPLIGSQKGPLPLVASGQRA